MGKVCLKPLLPQPHGAMVCSEWDLVHEKSENPETHRKNSNIQNHNSVDSSLPSLNSIKRMTTIHHHGPSCSCTFYGRCQPLQLLPHAHNLYKSQENPCRAPQIAVKHQVTLPWKQRTSALGPLQSKTLLFGVNHVASPKVVDSIPWIYRFLATCFIFFSGSVVFEEISYPTFNSAILKSMEKLPLSEELQYACSTHKSLHRVVSWPLGAANAQASASLHATAWFKKSCQANYGTKVMKTQENSGILSLKWS